MFSSKPSSRRGSSHKKDGESKKRKVVSSKNLQLTFENIVTHISKQQGDAVDKDSVVKMLKSIYDWMVFDPNMQLDLPTEFGSNSSAKMWPHGATVDTRRKPDGEREKDSSRKLKDVDEGDVVQIASSVVSSTLDEERSVKSKGEVMYATPRGQVYGANTSRAASVPYSQHQSYTSGPMFGEPPQTLAPQPRHTRMVPEGFHPSSAVPRAAQRYSVFGGAPPPERVNETPEILHAEPYPKKKGKKPKVGTTTRPQYGDDDGGEPVSFMD